MQASTSWDDVAFSSTEGDRHLGIRPVSQLNTWPVDPPVNASRRPSRDAAHHSGSGRMASPYPMGDFHLLFFASFSWRTPFWVKLRNTRNEQIFSALPPMTDILGGRLARLSSDGRECFHAISNIPRMPLGERPARA